MKLENIVNISNYYLIIYYYLWYDMIIYDPGHTYFLTCGWQLSPEAPVRGILALIIFSVHTPPRLTSDPTPTPPPVFLHSRAEIHSK